MTKKHAPSLKPKIIKITLEEQQQLTAAIQASNLDERITDFFIDLMFGNRWLVEKLEKGELTIAKLRKLFQVTTEKRDFRKHLANQNTNVIISQQLENNVLEFSTQNFIDTKSIAVKKGHGRNSASDYTVAQIIDINHEELKVGDPCPAEFCDGKLYEINPGVMIRIVGSPMASATRYNLQKLRCNICAVIYTAKTPHGLNSEKYDITFIALLLIHKYFISVPLYRQEVLQNYLGIPLPSSTQWDLIASTEKVLGVLYQAFVWDAAQGKGIAVDDTKARVLEQISKNKKALHKKDKKACYTTGMVSAHDDHLTYLFMTDDKTAGKSLAPVLALRDQSLPKPYLMCDALTANIPETISRDLYILCYCLVHARRQFYELPAGYDDLADYVISAIGKIYDHENQAKKLNAHLRLEFHQKHSQPIMDELREYLLKQQENFEPNSVSYAAINYMLKRWTELSQFLRYTDTPLDNNLTERALKLVIQLRKSSMFYKTLRGAKIASYIQTALYSAAQNNVNPYEYMVAILKNKEAVIANPDAWLPWKYRCKLQ